MKKSDLLLMLSFMLLMTSSFECAKKTEQPTPAAVAISSYAPPNPILRGLETNPFLRVTITNPSGNPAYALKQFRCSINQAALDQLLAIDLYKSSGTTFSTTQLIGTLSPSALEFTIPVDLSLANGTHFFWINARLKNSGNQAGPISIRCIKSVDASGKEITITQDNSAYDKYPGVALRKGGDDGVNTYRIPGIVRTAAGTLIAVYDIRYNNSGDLPGNIDVGMSRSTDNGNSWQPMRVIMDMGAPHDNNGVGDPTILFDPTTNKIFVAALWSKGNRSIAGSLPGISPDSTGQFVLVSSADDGLTWTTPYTITPQIKNPAWHLFFQGPGNGIAMQNGKLVFPAQYWDENKMPYSTLIYSDDHGQTWKGKINGPKSNTTESQLVETTAGTLMLNMRDNRGLYRSVSTTTNMGTTWQTHATSYSALPDPVCMASLIKATVKVNGILKEVLFFSNPNTSSGRYNMTIKASLDLGENWLPVNQILFDERTCFGYSSLVAIDAETIGILYEGNRDLYFVKYPVAAIIKP